MLNDEERKCIVWDIERGTANQIEPLPWETDTCIGNWHYDRSLYDANRYKSAETCHPDAVRHREQERQSAAEHPGARRRHD